MKKLLVCLVIIMGMILSSCSTVLNTTTQIVELKSDPPNAKIIIDGKKFGTSPQSVNINRGADHIIKFELDGYETYEIQVTRRISNWYYLNALNGFLPGMAADWFNGSMYNLYPEVIDIQLTPVKIEEPKKRR